MVEKSGLKVSSTLLEFINNEVIPNTNIDIDKFWNKFSEVVHELSPINKSLIQKREVIQKKIEERKDLFNRGYIYEKIELDDTFPKYLLDNKNIYKHFIL